MFLVKAFSGKFTQVDAVLRRAPAEQGLYVSPTLTETLSEKYKHLVPGNAWTIYILLETTSCKSPGQMGKYH